MYFQIKEDLRFLHALLLGTPDEAALVRQAIKRTAKKNTGPRIFKQQFQSPK